MSEITLEGKIVEVRGGERQISRTYTYGYISLRILVGWDCYSVLVDTSKLNKYGFLPKVGQWIHVEGILSKNENEFYDPSISRVSVLKHIENPKRR
jgi:hypothetical protein